MAATPGRDKCGPTASLKSMMRYDQSEACSGFVAQLRFDKNLFNTDKGKAAFITLAKAYFAGGGQQLSVNVLDRETLLDARKNPAAHGDLIVRVGGYSDYFVNLTPELQQNIIDRTEFSV
ncbi:MAG: glycine radical domain-containing protein [Candidatus Avispirillum sp.]